MVSKVSGRVAIPFPARACQGYLRQKKSRMKALGEASICGTASAKPGSQEKTKLPVLLGSRPKEQKHQSSLVSKFDESPLTATTTSGGWERSVSGLSGLSSTTRHSDEIDSSYSTCSWKLEVKNTFFHAVEVSDEVSPSGLTRCKSEPIILAKMSGGSSRIQAELQTWTLLPLSKAATKAQASTSVGSGLHGTGSCKPCAWFWKVEGCSNSVDCRHCHACPEGEIRRRRKANHTTRRRRKQSESSASLD